MTTARRRVPLGFSAVVPAGEALTMKVVLEARWQVADLVIPYDVGRSCIVEDLAINDVSLMPNGQAPGVIFAPGAEDGWRAMARAAVIAGTGEPSSAVALRVRNTSAASLDFRAVALGTIQELRA